MNSSPTVSMRPCWIIVVMAMSATTATMTQADVIARADRTQLYDNETFHLTIELPGNLSGEIDTKPLRRDFDVFDSMSSTQMQIVNGRGSTQRRLILTLAPKHAGQLTIPSLPVGNETTAPVTITVAKADSNQQARTQDVFIEVSTDKLNPVIQGQVIVTVKLWHSVPVRELGMSRLEGDDVLVERLGDDATYTAQREKRQFDVVERRFAMFPQRSGPMTIPGLRFAGKVADQRTRRASPPGFDAFGDPFGVFQTLVAVRGKSADLVLDVQPRPPGHDTRPWLPASAVQLSETWPEKTPSFGLGVPFTRTLRLQVDGLTAAQIPPLQLDGGRGVKMYADTPKIKQQVVDNGIRTTIDYTYTLVAAQAGEIELPAIELRWWSTTDNKEQIAHIPERRIRVTGDAGQSAATEPNTAAPTPAADNAQPADTGADGEKMLWPWLVVATALVVAIGIGTWLWRRRRGQNSSASNQRAVRSVEQARRKLLRAVQNHDARQMRDTLLAYAAAIQPENAPRTLAALAATLPEAAQTAVLALDQTLYGEQRGNWNPHDLIAAADTLKLATTPHLAETKPVLAKLYPSHNTKDKT